MLWYFLHLTVKWGWGGWGKQDYIVNVLVYILSLQNMECETAGSVFISLQSKTTDITEASATITHQDYKIKMTN